MFKSQRVEDGGRHFFGLPTSEVEVERKYLNKYNADYELVCERID
jgi:hypothetical protein